MALKEVVKELLTAVDCGVHRQFFWRQATFGGRYLDNFDTALKEKGITYNRVDNYGGEGRGEDYWSVYSFNNDNEIVYVKFDGYYASYDGSTFDSWFFVYPKEVKVTQWFSQE